MKQKTYLDKLMENKEFREKFEEEYRNMTNEEIGKKCDFLLDRYKELEEKIAKLYPPPYYYPPFYPCSPCYHDCFNCPYRRYPNSPYVTWQYTNVSNTAATTNCIKHCWTTNNTIN